MRDQFPRSWDGTDWEVFSLQLVQQRHGAENVQIVPDAVRGDAGIECFTTDGCCYQSYAPEEVADVAKAASAMKRKGARDIAKLKKNEIVIEGLLGRIKARRWILLCPFLDDKDVITHVTKRATDLVAEGVSYLAEEFRALVHCPTDFLVEIERLRRANAGVPLKVAEPTIAAVDAFRNQIDKSLNEKLSRGFGAEAQDKRHRRKDGIIRSSIRSENALARLKTEMPDLWDQAARAIMLEEERLEMVGPVPGRPADQLNAERANLAEVLTTLLRALDPGVVNVIAHGQIGTWLIECPLDFEVKGGSGE